MLRAETLMSSLRAKDCVSLCLFIFSDAVDSKPLTKTLKSFISNTYKK